MHTESAYVLYNVQMDLSRETFQYRRASAAPFCHSEATAEESRFYACLRFVEILRFAQDDRFHFIGIYDRRRVDAPTISVRA